MPKGENTTLKSHFKCAEEEEEADYKLRSQMCCMGTTAVREERNAKEEEDEYAATRSHSLPLGGGNKYILT